MLYLNYEYAQSLLDGPDSVVAVVSRFLHNEMILGSSRKLRPRWPFDMPYSYLSVSSVVASAIERQIAVAAPPCRLTAAGVPNLKIKPWRNHDFTALGLAARYIDKVNADSSSGTSVGRFDVEFTLQIACRVVNRDFLVSLNDRIACNDARGPETWEAWCELWTTRKDSDKDR